MAFVPIGMVEVSTIAVSIKVGDYITKRDDIGTFRFGGSSITLIFEKEKQLDFDFQGIRLSSFFLLIPSYYLGHCRAFRSGP